MAANGNNPTLGFSYSQNGLYSTASGFPVEDINGQTYYSNSGTMWNNLVSTSAAPLGNLTPGMNPAPLTCNSVSGCPGTFNINNINTNPKNNSSNDRVNYLASDATPYNTSRASTSENFPNFNGIFRFPYVPTEGSVNNMYCYEPSGPNGTGCEDGFICAQMDGILPLKYKDAYFDDNQTDSSKSFQGPATNICYGGNFNLVNTNYEDNKKDPIQPKSNLSRTPLYPERGVTLYQNPGCNRENNPSQKNNKYIGGTIKYQGKGVEIFGNCDVCFYANPFNYMGTNSQGALTGVPYDTIRLLQSSTEYSSDKKVYSFLPTDSYGFAEAKYGNAFNLSRTYGSHPSEYQANQGISYNKSNIYKCITVIRNDGIYSSIDGIDSSLSSIITNFGKLSNTQMLNYDAKFVDIYNVGGKIVMPNNTTTKDNNYVKYCGDYGLRFLPNDIHDASVDNLGSQDITKNKLIKGIFMDPTLVLNEALDLENPAIYGYSSEICPIPCAPNALTSNYILPDGSYQINNPNFFLTNSSLYDGFSSIYIPPHMEVISVCSYNDKGNIVRTVYPNPIRYEDSPMGDGCFPSFSPLQGDKFGIYGNSLVAISVRVRKDTPFLTKYVNNSLYNATAKTLEPAAPVSIGTVSTFRPDVMLIDPNPNNLPNINKGEYYQHKGKFPIEDAYSGYLTLNTTYKSYLDGKKPGWLTNLKKKLKGTSPNIEMLYNSVTTFRMNPSINVFSLEWLYVLYYCAMTNIGNGDGSGGCQATYVNEPFGSATGLLGNGYSNKCNKNNMSCLLFNKPLGCNTCNLTGNNMVLANGTTNVCGNAVYSEGQMGPSSADQFMMTYCSNMSNKIFPFYFSMYQAGNIDCACLANIGSCPFQNWLPCSQTSDQYKTAGKSGAYLQCASASATSIRDCQTSAINCANYNYQYGEDNYNSNQTANLSGTCLTIETASNNTPTQPTTQPTTTPTKTPNYMWVVIILLIVIVAIIGVVFVILNKKGYFK